MRDASALAGKDTVSWYDARAQHEPVQAWDARRDLVRHAGGVMHQGQGGLQRVNPLITGRRAQVLDRAPALGRIAADDEYLAALRRDPARLTDPIRTAGH